MAQQYQPHITIIPQDGQVNNGNVYQQQNQNFKNNPRTPSGAWVIPGTNYHASNRDPQTGYNYPSNPNRNIIEYSGGKKMKKSKKSRKSKKTKKSKKTRKTNRRH
jgi:hypothetical protein